MNKRNLVIGSIMCATLGLSLFIGATLALYQNQYKVHAHIESANYHASLFMTYQENDVLNDDGLIETEVVDLKDKYGEKYFDSSVPGINLGTYEKEIFNVENLCPTMGGEGKFKIFNLGAIPFNYSVEIINKEVKTLDENSNKFVDSDSSIIDQIIITNSKTSGTLTANSEEEFVITYKFQNLENTNSFYQNLRHKFTFDIVVKTSEAITEA